MEVDEGHVRHFGRNRTKDGAAHRMARKRRSDDRIIARLAAARDRLGGHHGSAVHSVPVVPVANPQLPVGSSLAAEYVVLLDRISVIDGHLVSLIHVVTNDRKSEAS